MLFWLIEILSHLVTIQFSWLRQPEEVFLARWWCSVGQVPVVFRLAWWCVCVCRGTWTRGNGGGCVRKVKHSTIAAERTGHPAYCISWTRMYGMSVNTCTHIPTSRSPQCHDVRFCTSRVEIKHLLPIGLCLTTLCLYCIALFEILSLRLELAPLSERLKLVNWFNHYFATADLQSKQINLAFFCFFFLLNRAKRAPQLKMIGAICGLKSTWN